MFPPFSELSLSSRRGPPVEQKNVLIASEKRGRMYDLDVFAPLGYFRVQVLIMRSRGRFSQRKTQGEAPERTLLEHGAIFMPNMKQTV